MKFFYKILFFAAPLFLMASATLAEDVNLSTYYPSPYGNYREMFIQEEDNTNVITDYTNALTRAGLNLITTYGVGRYTPGIFWSTVVNNPARPKGGIWMQENDDALTGSTLLFRTSDVYTAGLNAWPGMALNHLGDLGVGTDTPSAKIDAVDDDAVATVTDVLKLSHTLNVGAVAANFGTGLLFSGETTTAGTNRDMARIQSVWTTAADATRTAALEFQLTDNAVTRTPMILDADGDLKLIGANATPFVSAPTVDTALDIERNVDLRADLRLANLGANANVVGGNGSSRVLISSQQNGAGGTQPFSMALDSYSENMSAAIMGADAPGNVAITTLATFANITAGKGNLFIASRGTNNQRIAFYTNSLTMVAAAERMRIGTDAVTGQTRVGIGTTNPQRMLHVGADSAGKSTDSTWDIISDRRLKENIQPFTDGLSIVQKINPVSYQLNGKGDTPKGEKGISVIAQDVKDFMPYTLSTHRAKFNPEDEEETEFYDFSSSPLTFILINAVKELKTENDMLKSRIEALEKKLA